MNKNILKIIVLVMIFSISDSFGQGGWLLRESGTAQRLRSITTVDGNNVVSVGDSGTVITSQTAGLSWEVQKRIIWTPVPFALFSPMDLYGVLAISSKVLCAVGTKDSISRSTDGGITWTEIKCRTLGSCSGSNGPIVRHIYLASLDFDRSNHICVAVGNTAEALFSGDSGKHWEENLPNASALDLTCISSSNGVSISTSSGLNPGYVFFTTDRGDQWTGDWLNKNIPLNGCDIRGWTAVGNEGSIYHSLDKGLNWFPIASGTIANLNAVHFADKANGYIVGDGGLVLLTDDGGSSWKQQKTPTNENLRSVHFVDPFIGFICGDNGTILTTTNGGYSQEAVGATPQTGYSIKVYPNPTSMLTTISVNIPHRSQFHLRIYNMLGEEVALLAEGSFESGRQNFPWNIGSVANGVYVCKLEADGMILQSQIVVQK